MIRRMATLLILLFGTSVSAPAIQFERTDNYALAAEQRQADELWLVTQSADASGTYEDDLFMFCATTGTLTGSFQNDVWVFASDVAFSGNASEHVRVLSRALWISGTIGKSLAAAANSVNVQQDAVLAGDAVIFGENVLIEGTIEGGVRIMAYSATVTGRIGGNLRIVAEDIVITPGTEIGGDLIYTCSSELVLDSKVILNGQLVRKEIDATDVAGQPTSLSQTYTLQIFLYLCAMVAALPFISIFPQFTGTAVRTLRQSTGKCALAGLAAFCLLPMIAFFAFITLIGIPLSALLIGVYGILLYLSKVIVALVIGGIALRRRGPQPFSRVFVALSLGLLVLYFASSLPLFGFAVRALTTLLGLGALVLAVFGTQTRPVPGIPNAHPAMPPPIPRRETGLTSDEHQSEDNDNQTKE